MTRHVSSPRGDIRLRRWMTTSQSDEPVIMVSIDRATPKLNPKMLLISSRAIFERVRLTIPNVTLEEVQDTIMQSLPYKGGRRQ